MQRIRAFLITLIILALAVHLVWIAIAPLLPGAVIGLVLLGVLGALYYRKRRW
jgi:LPXTG-motif cell wall-anchored protein